MTKEELLKPRYKVIALFPLCDLKLGDIISFETPHVPVASYCALNGNQIKYAVPEETIKDYPHLFKPLQWWEDRNLADLPEYVKCIETPDQRIIPGCVLKVAWNTPNWGTNHNVSVILDTNCYIPATLEEYEAYIKTTTAK